MINFYLSFVSGDAYFKLLLETLHPSLYML